MDKLPDHGIEQLIGDFLVKKGLSIAVAESCTGGRIASRITRIPGSSRYFESACVTYSNRSKERLLSVPGPLLEEKGAVSPEVVLAMARGVREKAGVDIGLAVTGIAGREGGSQKKPLGLVYIALSDRHRTVVSDFHFRGNRGKIQDTATQKALETLGQYLSDKECLNEMM